MNALLQLIPNLINLIKELPLKSKMAILIMSIILGGGIYSFVKYLEYKSEIEQIHADTQIRLAEINTANPDANNYKEDRNPKKVKRIVNKDTLQVAEVAFN